MPRYRRSREEADSHKVFIRLERAYKALHELTVRHYNLCDEVEEKFLDTAEDELLRLLRRYNPMYGKE